VERWSGSGLISTIHNERFRDLTIEQIRDLHIGE